MHLLHPSTNDAVPFADGLTPAGLPAARARFLEAFADESKAVTIDLSGSTGIDLFGLQVIVGAAMWAAEQGRAFSVVNAPAILVRMAGELGLSIRGVEPAVSHDDSRSVVIPIVRGRPRELARCNPRRAGRTTG